MYTYAYPRKFNSMPILSEYDIAFLVTSSKLSITYHIQINTYNVASLEILIKRSIMVNEIYYVYLAACKF